MKTHGTVMITRKLLEHYNACRFGLQCVAALLPARISTNVDDNFDLACQLAQVERPDVGWLATVVGLRAFDDVYKILSLAVLDQNGDADQDPMVIAQRLAMIADKMLSDKGR